MNPSQWRVLSKCHDVRNFAEYEGQTEIDARLLANLLVVAGELESAMESLRPSDHP